MPYFGGLFEDEPLPKDGWIDLPDRPGFGVTLSADTRARMRRPHARTEAASERQFKRNAERKRRLEEAEEAFDRENPGISLTPFS